MIQQAWTDRKARSVAALVATALAACAIATPAGAVSCKAPPGMSAIDQYCEAMPGPGGDRGNSDRDRGGRQLPPSALHALEGRGPAGQSIIGLSARAQAQAAKDHKAAPGAATDGGVAANPLGAAHGRADRPSENPISAVTTGLGGAGDTVGSLFGTLLLVVALGFVGMSWLRYRRRAQG